MKASGFDRARRQSRKRKAGLNAAARAALAETAADVHRAGLENMDLMVKRDTGKLRRGYRTRIAKSGLSAMVGYVSAAARKAAFYARFVHDGTATARPLPYHDAAVLEHEGRHRARMREANKVALDNRAAPSGTGRSGGSAERSLK